MAIYDMYCECGEVWTEFTSGATGPSYQCKCGKRANQRYSLSGGVYTKGMTPQEQALHLDNVKMIHDKADQIIDGRMTLKQGKGDHRIEVPYKRKLY